MKEALYRSTDLRTAEEKEFEEHCSFRPVTNGESPFISERTLRNLTQTGRRRRPPPPPPSGSRSRSPRKRSPVRRRRGQSILASPGTERSPFLTAGSFFKGKGFKFGPPVSAGVPMFYFSLISPPSFETGKYTVREAVTTTTTTSSAMPGSNTAIGMSSVEEYEEVDVTDDDDEGEDTEGGLLAPPFPDWANGSGGPSNAAKKPVQIVIKKGPKKELEAPAPTGWQAVLLEMQKKKEAMMGGGLKKIEPPKEKPKPQKKKKKKKKGKDFKDVMDELNYKLAKMRGDLEEDDDDDDEDDDNDNDGKGASVKKSDDGAGAGGDHPVSSAGPSAGDGKGLKATLKPSESPVSSAIAKPTPGKLPNKEAMMSLLSKAIRPPPPPPPGAKPTTKDSADKEGEKPKKLGRTQTMASIPKPAAASAVAGGAGEGEGAGKMAVPRPAFIPAPPMIPAEGMWPPAPYTGNYDHLPPASPRPPPASAPSGTLSTSGSAGATPAAKTSKQKKTKKVRRLVKKQVPMVANVAATAATTITTTQTSTSLVPVQKDLPVGYYLPEPMRGMVDEGGIREGGVTSQALCDSIKLIFDQAALESLESQRKPTPYSDRTDAGNALAVTLKGATSTAPFASPAGAGAGTGERTGYSEDKLSGVRRASVDLSSVLSTGHNQSHGRHRVSISLESPLTPASVAASIAQRNSATGGGKNLFGLSPSTAVGGNHLYSGDPWGQGTDDDGEEEEYGNWGGTDLEGLQLDRKLTISDLPLPYGFHAQIERMQKGAAIREEKRQKQFCTEFRNFLNPAYEQFASQQDSPSGAGSGVGTTGEGGNAGSSRKKPEPTVAKMYHSHVAQHLEQKAFSHRKPVEAAQLQDAPMCDLIESAARDPIRAVSKFDGPTTLWVNNLRPSTASPSKTRHNTARGGGGGGGGGTGRQSERHGASFNGHHGGGGVGGVDDDTSSLGMSDASSIPMQASGARYFRNYRPVTEGKAPELRADQVLRRRQAQREEREELERQLRQEQEAHERGQREKLRLQAQRTALEMGAFRENTRYHRHQKLISKYSQHPHVGVNLDQTAKMAYLDYTSKHHLRPSDNDDLYRPAVQPPLAVPPSTDDSRLQYERVPEAWQYERAAQDALEAEQQRAVHQRRQQQLLEQQWIEQQQRQQEILLSLKQEFFEYEDGSGGGGGADAAMIGYGMASERDAGSGFVDERDGELTELMHGWPDAPFPYSNPYPSIGSRLTHG